jgi:hypothetical protein
MSTYLVNADFSKCSNFSPLCYASDDQSANFEFSHSQIKSLFSYDESYPNSSWNYQDNPESHPDRLTDHNKLQRIWSGDRLVIMAAS